MQNKNNQGLVYSTDQGRICPECGNAINLCNCNNKDKIPETDGIVRVGRETKGRKGKGVTTITGVPLKPSELKKLTKKLKQKCSSGGSIKDNVIEIQGDFKDLVADELVKLKYTVKKVGG